MSTSRSKTHLLCLNQEEMSATPIPCRCGGEPSAPKQSEGCTDRWEIHCSIASCHAQVTGQGLRFTVLGWNRLSLHLYR